MNMYIFDNIGNHCWKNERLKDGYMYSCDKCNTIIVDKPAKNYPFFSIKTIDDERVIFKAFDNYLKNKLLNNFFKLNCNELLIKNIIE